MKILSVIAVVIMAAVLAGCAATMPAAPAVDGDPGVSAGPAGKSPYQCFTDDGYGRFRHCDEIE